mmetsp:Transcript_39363/g.95211  ORF Transcript_39363/g.95211 Transcript_39363/m.95211 type:complete len:780 (+) Transcript_39363:297-2636(+)
MKFSSIHDTTKMTMMLPTMMVMMSGMVMLALQKDGSHFVVNGQVLTLPPAIVPDPDLERIPCNICRNADFNDRTLGNPTGTIFSFLGLDVSCQQAQDLGNPLFGIGYTVEQCATAQAAAVERCGCPGEPTPAPVAAPVTSAPTSFEGVYCLLCPLGNEATGTGSVGSEQCQDIDMMGRNRQLSVDECLAVQTRAAQDDDPCGCATPTSAPTQAPTPSPTQAPTHAPTAQEVFPCNICRDGGQLTDGGALLFTQLGMPVSCAEFQSVGLVPGLTVEQCGTAQSLARGTCGCPFEPTPAPEATPAPTLAPETVFCTVCFNGNLAMGAGSIGGELCQKLDRDGRSGKAYTDQECLIIQTAAAVAEDDPCQCIDPTASPTTAPSSAPSHSPTTSPTTAPSDSPSASPSVSPSVSPSASPTASPSLSPSASPTTSPSASPTEETKFFCNICRDAPFGDYSLGNPGGTLVSFLGFEVSCAFAQFIGGPTNPNGPVYTLEQCAIAQAAALDVCGCPGEPTPAPVKTIGTPTTAPPTVAPETVYCLICPEGTMAMGTGSVGGMQCQDVDMMGRNRELTENECLAAQTRAAQEDDPCECTPMDRSDPAVVPAPTAPVPSPAPVQPVATAPSPTEITDLLFQCNICREGGQPQDPGETIFTFGFFGQIAVSCGAVQGLGDQANGGPGLTTEQCGIAQALARDTCGCPFEPTPAPNNPVPATPSPTEAPPVVFCTVCFNGQIPTNPNTALGGVLCGALDTQGRDSMFNAEECLRLQTAAAVSPSDTCGCL